MTNYTQSGYPKGLGMLSIPSKLNAPLLMCTDSDRNLSVEADPNPARKTRERVLTYVLRGVKEGISKRSIIDGE